MRKDSLLTAGRVAGVIALLFIAMPGLVWLTGGTFGQRCERLHPDTDAATIEQCVADLQDPLRAAYREGVKAGTEATLAEMKKQLGQYTLTPVRPAPAE